MKALIFSLLLLALPQAYAADRLTEDGVRSFYNQLTAAAQARNVDGVLGHMSEDARVLIKGADAGGDMNLDMTQYRDLLRQGWSTLDGYQVTVAIQRIEVAEDGQSATLNAQTEESYQLQGQTQQSRSQETANLRLVDGEPKITQVEVVVQP